MNTRVFIHLSISQVSVEIDIQEMLVNLASNVLPTWEIKQGLSDSEERENICRNNERRKFIEPLIYTNNNQLPRRVCNNARYAGHKSQIENWTKLSNNRESRSYKI